MGLEILWHGLLPSLSVLLSGMLLIKLINRKVPIITLVLFGCLLLMGLSQFLGYVVAAWWPEHTRYFADAYLISAYFFFATLALFALNLNPEHRVNHQLFFYLLPTALAVLHVGGFMVESYRFEQNSLMHTDGPMAPAFDLFALFCCMATIGIARLNIKQFPNDGQLLTKSKLLLWSFAPIAICFGVLIVLSKTDYAISLAVVGPLIIIYTAIAYFYIAKKQIIDCSIGSTALRQRAKLAYQLIAMQKLKDSLKELNRKIQQQFITEAFFENGSSYRAAAEQLGYDESYVRKQIKEYGLVDGQVQPPIIKAEPIWPSDR